MSRFVVRHPAVVVVLWLLACLALIPASRHAGELLDVAARVPASESAQVERILAEDFESPFARYSLLVATGLPPIDSPRGREALGEIVSALKRVAGVTGTLSHLDARDPFLVGAGGSSTFLVVGLDPVPRGAESQLPALRAATEALAGRLQRESPGVALRWTGEAALNLDLRKASAQAARRAEARALPVTLVLLLLVFGALAATLLPLALGLLSISLALGGAAVATALFPLSILLQNVATMLGLGLGIDYALLTVSRFREALAAGRDSRLAAEEAGRHAGRTVALSGATVAIGFTGLLLAPVNELRSVAAGGLLVVTAAVLLATTLLPAVLSWLGPRVDALSFFARRETGSGVHWRRWGTWIAEHPRSVLLAAGLPVVLLSLQTLRLRTDLPRGDWLPPALESARALQDLRAMGRGGVLQTTRVLLQLPDDVSALGPEGWAAVERLTRLLSADPRVERVRSLSALAGEGEANRLRANLAPARVKRSFVGAEGSATVLEVVPCEGADPVELKALVRELRSADAARATGIAGARILVGGLPAFNVDYEAAVVGHFPRIVGLVVGATLLALCVAFRSLLIPIKAVALNLLSVGAAFGACVLVFQDGRGSAWLGVRAPTGALFPAVPTLVFCIVFGLSMDYEVFLMARIAEARRAGLPERLALAEGLARTGAVISGAAAIMIAVFGAFALADFLLIQMLGFALAVAVLLDATLIRLALGPALFALAGRWNWWPGSAHSLPVE